jgi:hypothetical protein
MTRIQFRRDTAASWTANNPVLTSGEIGLEVDTLKFKLGDGSTSWNGLAYVQTIGPTGPSPAVKHNTDATVARPSIGTAIWIGSVEPNNALDGDIWMDTSGTAPVITTTVLNSFAQGIYSDQTLAVTGTAPIVLIGSGLPPGLALSSSGQLHGTPTTPGDYSFTVTASNGFPPSDTKQYTGTIGPAVPPTITTTALGGSIRTGIEYRQPLMYTGSSPVTWTLNAGTLPDGLLIESQTGLIYGTPTAYGSYTFTIRATNSAGYFDQAFTGSVLGTPPSITLDSLNPLSQGAAFSQIITAVGTATITFAVQSGTLPAGLSLNTSTGVLSGTPTSSGSYNFTVRATNSFGYADMVYAGAIASGIPVITTSSINTIYKSVAFVQAIVASGGTPITFAVQSGTLPAGLSLNTSTGVLSGTASAVASYTFTIRATNSYGQNDKQFTVTTVESRPVIVETSLKSIRVNRAFSQTLTLSTGLTPVTWSLVAGVLPTGLSLSSSGTISGTPTTQTVYSFTIRASNSVGYSDQVFSGNVVPEGVSFSAAGTYAQSPTLDTTYTVNGPDAQIGDTIILWVNTYVDIFSVNNPTLTATYDGSTSMQLKGLKLFSAFGIACFALTNIPSSGVKTIQVTSDRSTGFRLQSIAYSNVNSVGSASYSENTFSHTVASSVGNMVAQEFTQWPVLNVGSISSYNQTQRKNVSAYMGLYLINTAYGDAPGSPSVTFSATAPSPPLSLAVELTT